MGPYLPLNTVTSVQRSDGRDLGRAPHIAMMGSCKLRNFVACLSSLRLLRRHYPEAQIDFWDSEATADFKRAICGDCQPLDWRISRDQPGAKRVEALSRLGEIANAAAHRQGKAWPLYLAINCEGFKPLTQTLTSWLQPTWVAKIWPFQALHTVLQWCAKRFITVGLVGAPLARQRLDCLANDDEDQILADHLDTQIDLRGRTNLIQLAGAWRRGRIVVSVNAGPMNVATGVGKPTLAVVCNENRFHNDECLAETHHYTMQGMDTHQVIRWLEATLA